MTDLNAGTFSKKYQWKNKTELKVCWATEALIKKMLPSTDPRVTDFGIYLGTEQARSDQALIAKVVQTNFTLGSAGVKFSGFKDCPLTTGLGDYDFIVLSYRENAIGNGVASIGNENVWSENFEDTGDKKFWRKLLSATVTRKLPGYIMISGCKTCDTLAVNSTTEMSYFALHEFGHAAGLLHEDARQNVNNALVNEDQSSFAPFYPSIYDEQSVMSYHYLYNVIARLGLTVRVDAFGFLTSSYASNYTSRPWLADDILSVYPRLDQWKDHSAYYRIKDSQYQIIPKLSEGDLHSLRCMFKKNPTVEICNKSFDPRR